MPSPMLRLIQSTNAKSSRLSPMLSPNAKSPMLSHILSLVIVGSELNKGLAFQLSINLIWDLALGFSIEA